MTAMIGHAVATVVVQVLLYVVLPYRFAARLARERGTSDRVLLALLLGISSQALLGYVFNTAPWRGQWLEPWLYVVGWLTVSLFTGPIRITACDSGAAAREALPLAAILLLAYIVRILHPLETWALGQSDAYGHLQYVQDIVRRGHLANPVYPPGHAWLMFLTCHMSGQDPYYVCRFGGAFFGLGMVLAVFALVREFFGRQEAYASAALAAGCAAFNLLIKTGVGSFANQVGLLLVPAILWALALWGRHDYRWRPWGWLTALFAVCLAATVPMMLLHLMLLMGLLRVAALFVPAERHRWFRVTLMWGFALVGAVAAAGLLVVGAETKAQAQTTRMLTGDRGGQRISRADRVERVPRTERRADENPRVATMARQALGDFFSVKRLGLGSLGLNVAMLGLGAAFLVALVAGVRRGNEGLLLLGAWGTLAAVTTYTGALQFSQYQREGWSLAIAAVCVCGVTFGVVRKRMDAVPLRRVLAPGLVAASLTGLLLHPAHRVFSSPAESEVVRLLLAIEGDRAARRDWAEASPLWEDRISTKKAVVVARRFSGFNNRRGDPVAAIRGRFLSRTEIDDPAPGVPTYVLIDHENDGVGTQRDSLMAVLQPELTAHFRERRSMMKMRNAELLDAMESMTNVVRSRVAVSANLDVWVLDSVHGGTADPGPSESPARAVGNRGGGDGDN